MKLMESKTGDILNKVEQYTTMDHNPSCKHESFSWKNFFGCHIITGKPVVTSATFFRNTLNLITSNKWYSVQHLRCQVTSRDCTKIARSHVVLCGHSSSTESARELFKRSSDSSLLVYSEKIFWFCFFVSDVISGRLLGYLGPLHLALGPNR